MPLVAIGIDWSSLPANDFGRYFISEEDMLDRLKVFSSAEGVEEAILVCTCARTEVFAEITKFHGGIEEMWLSLARILQVERDELASVAKVYYERGAVSHLLRVSSGLESELIGETEILGQVRRAFVRSHDAGYSGPALYGLFRKALEVGKRARNETGIARGITSSAHAAVELFSETCGLDGEGTVMVVGVGEIGSKIAEALSQGGYHVYVASRTFDKAVQLANRINAKAIHIHDFKTHIEELEGLFFATSTKKYLLDTQDCKYFDLNRNPNTFVVDMGVPRNVDPGLDSYDRVNLFDLDGVNAFVKTAIDYRQKEVGLVEEMIEVETSKFFDLKNSGSAASTLASLYAFAEEIRLLELARFAGRLEGLTDAQKKAVESLTYGIVQKMLHRPVVKVKEQSGSKQGERLVEDLSFLFDL
ncbi:MAG: glutamyl-tRNA reductase [Acidimicrobiaceae bacterium]|nr:glutamyl-tRNA reductase [Acidimicrobiaceae bacterium]